MKNESTQAQEVQADRKPYARPQLIKHGSIENQTQLTTNNPSQLHP